MYHAGDEWRPLAWYDILFSFRGRISRRTFWLANLAWMASGLLVLFVVSSLFSTMTELMPLLYAFLWFCVMFYYVTFSAIAAKRWHDRDKSGWWSLIALIPFGNFWMLIELGFLRGTEGANRFGPQT